MTTFITETLTTTIDAPFDEVVADLADVNNHPLWATEFFAGPTRPTNNRGEVLVTVPIMGGEVRFRADTNAAHGVIDLFLAPVGAPFGPALPIRVLPNVDGADVLFTLTRFPGMPDPAWEHGLESMRKELEQLKTRLEGMATS